MDTARKNSTDSTGSRFVYEQLREECLAYNEAVGSFNRHLDNHRDRMDLQEIPYRLPVETPETPEEMQRLLDKLLSEVHLDSEVRRHPRTVPIHEEAIEHLALAREQLVRTLENELIVE